MSTSNRNNLVIVGYGVWDNPEKRSSTNFCKHIEDEICHAGKDIRIVSTSEIDLGISKGKLFLRLSDGTIYRQGDENLPRWALCYVVPPRVVFILEQIGIACFSSYQMMSLFADKMLSHAMFSGIFAQPDTLFIGSDDTVDSICRDIDSYPFMLKGVSGCGGNNVEKIDDFDEMISFLDEKEMMTELIMFQKLMPSADDLRVYILGDEILGAVIRHPQEGIWKANLEFDPIQEEYELSDDEEEAIRKAMDFLPKRRRGLYSFDFLFDDERRLVMCEANCCIGTNALESVGLADNLFLRYIDYIRREMNREANEIQLKNSKR